MIIRRINHRRLRIAREPLISVLGDQRQGGFAIVLVLAVLVLMLVVSLALFSRAQTNRQISASSAANRQVDLLADAAVQILVKDLNHEIEAGSVPDAAAPAGDGRSLLYPRMISSGINLLGSNVPISTAPSMLPARTVSASPAAPSNLIKQSQRNTPFFAVKPGVVNGSSLPAIPNRAAAVSTTAAPASGRAMTQAEWAEPKLAAVGETVPAPDWIYINRVGQTPTTFSADWEDRDLANDGFIIGRFAYSLYNVGGLIDINVVGNALSDTENAERGRLHQVSLAGAPGDLNVPAFADFVAWRSPAETAETLADPKRTFTTVPSAGQAFVNRQDLIDYVETDPSPLPIQALPFLSVGNRDLDAPIFSVDPELIVVQPANFDAEEINASLVTTRFDAETNLDRGSGPAVTVPAGTSILARKFPLSKIALLADENADPDDLEYYFGLERQADGSFHYTATSTPDSPLGAGRIMRPSEIADKSREPNFFEILQAVLPAGSLGQSVGNTYTIDHPRDILRNLQIMQIGANILDQWDGDDFPTAIGYPGGNADEWLMHYGVENLPYINSFEFVAHHPEWSDSRFQVWMLFSVWNPHQSAGAPADGIAEFRIQPVRSDPGDTPSFEMLLGYYMRITSELGSPYGLTTTGQLQNFLGNTRLVMQDFVGLNAGRQLIFPNNGSYLDPQVVRASAPADESDQPGLLASNVTTDPADAGSGLSYVAPIVSEDPLLVANDVRNGASGPYGINPILEYLLKKNHQANGLPEPTAAELQAARLPPDGTGFFGAKAFNYFRVRSRTNDRPVIHLQYRLAGSSDWKTYQVIDRLVPMSQDARLDGVPPDPNTRGYSSGSDTRIDFINSATTWQQLEAEANRVRLKSAANWVGPETEGLPQSFYRWRTAETLFGALKYDPRTIRFGHPGHNSFLLGDPGDLPNAAASQPRTIQSTRAAPTWSSYGTAAAISRQSPWVVSNSSYRIGLNIGRSGVPVFTPNPFPNFEWSHLLSNVSGGLSTPVGFIRNIPEAPLNSTTNLSRYRDNDGIIRPADGYVGASPALPVAGEGTVGERPVMLNRPFRSVGELGYVFRDLPWKTLDLFTRNSADLGLLDVFSVDEFDEPEPLVAGKVNLNSAPAEVLTVLLRGSGKTTDGASVLSATDARNLADAIVDERTARGPFFDVGDLVRRVLSPTAADQTGVLLDNRKHEREAAIRALGSVGTTRTWNFLLDIVLQSGRMRSGATSADQFQVQAEKRFWVHLAVDRLTGEVISQNWETVYE